MLPGLASAVVRPGKLPVSVGTPSTYFSETVGSSFTATGLSTVTADQYPLIGLVARSGILLNVSSITLGGASCTELATAASAEGSSAGRRLSFYVGPKGQTGNLSVTLHSGLNRVFAAILWPVANLESTTPTDTASTTTSLSTSIDIEKDGAGLAIMTTTGSANAAANVVNWTGLTENVEHRAYSNTIRVSAASQVLSSAASGRAISATGDSTIAAQGLLVVALR